MGIPVKSRADIKGMPTAPLPTALSTALLTIP
jgi:hypothetical protein